MKIFLVHNFYQQKGGEDLVFLDEMKLLKSYGEDVLNFTLHNDDVAKINKFYLLMVPFWNNNVYLSLRKIFRREKPDIVHVHNILPLVSPAVYHAAKAEGLPVVQTLHNYRLFCPGAFCFRDMKTCEDCLKKFFPWPGVRYACYRQSRLATSVVGAMVTAHKLMGTWSRKIDTFIALTEFSRQKFIQAGFPAEKIAVKPNFVGEISEGKTLKEFENNSKYHTLKESKEEGFLYVGRLSREKGIETLIEAWKKTNSGTTLTIVGDGPLGRIVKKAASQDQSIIWVGQRVPQVVYELMAKVRALVFPSECYETFGRVAIEAFAMGTPVIASKIGAIEEIVQNGRTGMHFKPGDAEDLSQKLVWAQEHPDLMVLMGKNAKEEYDSKYNSEVNS